MICSWTTHTECIVVFHGNNNYANWTQRYVTHPISERYLLKLHCPVPLHHAFGLNSEPLSSIHFRFDVSLRSTPFSNRYHTFGYLNYNFFLSVSASPLVITSLSYFTELDSIIPHMSDLQAYLMPRNSANCSLTLYRHFEWHKIRLVFKLSAAFLPLLCYCGIPNPFSFFCYVTTHSVVNII